MNTAYDIARDRHAAAPIARHSDAQLVRINADAEDRVLADMEEFSNWLACVCIHQNAVIVGNVPRDDIDLMLLVETMTVPRLLALALYPCAEVQGMAMRELGARYLDASGPALEAARVEVAADLDDDADDFDDEARNGGYW